MKMKKFATAVALALLASLAVVATAPPASAATRTVIVKGWDVLPYTGIKFARGKSLRFAKSGVRQSLGAFASSVCAAAGSAGPFAVGVCIGLVNHKGQQVRRASRQIKRDGSKCLVYRTYFPQVADAGLRTFLAQKCSVVGAGGGGGGGSW